MAISPETMTVKNDELANTMMDAGRRLVERGMALRDYGMEVALTYARDDDSNLADIRDLLIQSSTMGTRDRKAMVSKAIHRLDNIVRGVAPSPRTPI